jgi:hypothetical protein
MTVSLFSKVMAELVTGPLNLTTSPFEKVTVTLSIVIWAAAYCLSSLQPSSLLMPPKSWSGIITMLLSLTYLAPRAVFLAVLGLRRWDAFLAVPTLGRASLGVRRGRRTGLGLCEFLPVVAGQVGGFDSLSVGWLLVILSGYRG